VSGIRPRLKSNEIDELEQLMDALARALAAAF